MLIDKIVTLWRKPWVPPALCGLLGALALASWLRPAEVKTVEVVREQVVYRDRIEYVDRVQVVTEQKARLVSRKVKETKPDGTKIQTKEVIQEGGQRSASSRDTRSTVEQTASRTKETSKITVATIPRYSLAVTVGTGVLVGLGSQQVGLEVGARLGNLPVFVTTQLQVPVDRFPATPAVSLGVRYEF